MDSYTFEFVPQEEESTPDSIYPQPALVHPGDACTWDSSLWVYHQLDYVNRNDTQYPIVNNGNDAQVVPTASFGPANYTTNTTPLVAPFTQESTSQEPLEAEVIGNGINSDETPDVHHQGREQELVINLAVSHRFSMYLARLHIYPRGQKIADSPYRGKARSPECIPLQNLSKVLQPKGQPKEPPAQNPWGASLRF
ncbi:hypothetical protein N7501_009282 [Penicillium viridicatum]|nr:hypothetical protein N7501_009282 [Penicillium viridicatum]